MCRTEPMKKVDLLKRSNLVSSFCNLVELLFFCVRKNIIVHSDKANRHFQSKQVKQNMIENDYEENEHEGNRG